MNATGHTPNLKDMKSRLLRFAFPLALAAAIALHLATVFITAPPRIVFSGTPIPNLYFDQQIDQTYQVTDALGQWGEGWAYDPSHASGTVVGTFVDTNSRAWQLWTYQLSKLGLQRGTAFNTFVLLAHLLAPWVLALAAGLFGLGRWPCLIAGMLGGLLWFFDGTVHWQWWSGTVPYPLASYLSVLCAALLWQFTRTLKWYSIALFAIALTVTLLTQPYAGLALLVPAAVVYGGRASKMKLWHHGAVVAAIAVAIGLNATWLGIGLRFAHLDNASSTLGLGTLSHLFTDFLGFTSDTNVSGGIGMRSGFRFLTLGAALITLVLWRRDKDKRFWPFAAGLGALLCVAYLGGYLPGINRIQPYRFIIPALFLAVVPAAALIDELRARKAFAKLPAMAYATLGIIVLAAIPRLARDVVYFIPPLVPQPINLPEETPHIADIIGFGNVGYPRHRDFRHGTVPQHVENVVKWVENWDPSQGRILVEYAPLADHLAWRTKADILGGSVLRDRGHGRSNFFWRYPSEDPPQAKLRWYLETYAVGWIVILNNPGLGELDYRPRLRSQTELLKTVAKVRPFELMRSQLPISYFQAGTGKIETSLNKIKVSESPPNTDLVLRYHYLSSMVCTPNCSVRKKKISGDPIGFIEVPAPHPANFVIKNNYLK
jgi:hypothetical protein